MAAVNGHAAVINAAAAAAAAAQQQPDLAKRLGQPSTMLATSAAAAASPFAALMHQQPPHQQLRPGLPHATAPTSTTAAVTANLLATAPQSLHQAAFRPQQLPPPQPQAPMAAAGVPSSAVLAATLRSAPPIPGAAAGQMLTAAASPYITAAPLMRKMTAVTSIPSSLAAGTPSITTTAVNSCQDLSMLEAATMAAVNQNNNNADDG